MKLVVGLGNPGRRYQQTRHNVGYDVLAELARRFGPASAKKKFHGEVMELMFGGERALLLSPTTYMNRSGTSVQEAQAFYKLPLDDILVVCDDLNLPLAKLRARRSGSAGGQKGLADIINRLGGDGFPRLRIGIGSPPEGWHWPDFVLSKFNSDEKKQITEAVSRAAEGVVTWARDGIDACMNEVN
jgi:PTH1 family peptidyl-tRNA hydrolase